MQLEEIKKLAKLARINMSEEEMIGITKDFDSILAYIGQVQEAEKLIKSNSDKLDLEESGSLTFNKNSHLRFGNIMREDIVTEDPGMFTDKIIKEMPDSQDGYLKVRQIL